MKHLNKFLVAVVLFAGFNTAMAQDENNPWSVEIGANAVDTFPVGLRDGQENPDSRNGEFTSEYFNIEDHWNILPSISRIAVSRYVGNGFTFGVAGSINRIDKLGDVRIEDVSYYGVDGEIKYSFRNLINGQGGWFDPSIGIGGGYTWIDGDVAENSVGVDNGNVGFGTANGIAGVKFWFSEKFAINVQSAYKYAFEDETGIRHFQHSVGAVFQFGGKDTDGDGIYDKDDECPETPGLAEFNGCPDSDGDGIEDRLDECPNVPGTAEFNGCVDTDGDGIADPKDRCPNEAGPAANGGCPWPDTDGDGLLDKDDACPNEAGPASNNGCPILDSDGDGVNDDVDQCPEVAGTVANNGCPEVTIEIMNQLNEYSKTILFDYDKATIRQESYGALQSITDIMQEYPSARFLIEGHTDSKGRDAYNLKLSNERAASVRAYLTSKGISSSRLTSKGFGESQPIATNKTAAGRQENRRVNITLVKN